LGLVEKAQTLRRRESLPTETLQYFGQEIRRGGSPDRALMGFFNKPVGWVTDWTLHVNEI